MSKKLKQVIIDTLLYEIIFTIVLYSLCFFFAPQTIPVAIYIILGNGVGVFSIKWLQYDGNTI